MFFYILFQQIVTSITSKTILQKICIKKLEAYFTEDCLEESGGLENELAANL
jgi:hypothetical protein